MKKSAVIFLFFSLFLIHKSGFAEQTTKVDFCKVYGSVYVETNKALATYRVFKEEEESFSDLVINKQSSQLMGDRSG